jgi:nicotinamidase-related amidase
MEFADFLGSWGSRKGDGMKILVVIDMQNDFIDGALGSAEAAAVVEKVSEKIKKYRENKLPVIFTRDTHTQEYLNTQEGRNLPVPHCFSGTKGWEISSKLEVADSIVIDKPAFGSLKLAEAVSRYHNPEEIELVGICTDICVISNAIIKGGLS